MYNLRKRKTAPEGEGSPSKDEAEKRTSTGKRPRPKSMSRSQTLPQPDPDPPRPKKKQSQYQLARINRAQHQRIFLMQAQEWAPWNWSFQVIGSTGNYYRVMVNRTLSCSCMDFQRQKRPCKHIYFIVCRVAQFDELLRKMPNSTSMTQTNLELLSTMLRDRLGARLKKNEAKGDDHNNDHNKQELEPKEEIKLGDDKDCAICFEELEETEDLKQCRQCKKYLHTECIRAWLTKNSTCPLCRGDMSTILVPPAPMVPLLSPSPAADLDLSGLDPSDPLYHLRQVRLLAE